MSKISLLSEEQVWGNRYEGPPDVMKCNKGVYLDGRLDVLKKYGTACAVTDFCILLGAYVSAHYTNEGKTLTDRAGFWWTASQSSDGCVRVASKVGAICARNPSERNIAVRPCISLADIPETLIKAPENVSGIFEIQYGEYPQTVAPMYVTIILEQLLQTEKLKKTGKAYTIDSRKYGDREKGFLPRRLTEYEYDGKKYVQVKANSDFGGQQFELSNGVGYLNGDYVWIEVLPVAWFVDRKAGVALSKKSLFSGVKFVETGSYFGDFENTWMHRFLNVYFGTELLCGNEPSGKNDLSQERGVKRNPYRFSFDSVTEEEIIAGAVQSGVAVFLHGKSGDGKSARIRQLDPDCEILYLRNASPELLNGKSVYNSNTGEMLDIPPTWYKKVCEKCKREPDKIHILFFDELSNAYPSIQGMAFNIILDREVNGIWKIPDNCRIVAAGNEMKESLAANELVEPLFGRFGHVYIETDADSWLKWGATPQTDYKRLDFEQKTYLHKIHPAVYAFIAYKKELALRSRFTGEKPNADPRKWEMVSRILYQTGKPEMLRAFVGSELTHEFCHFCRQQVISLQDVIEGNYDRKIIEAMNVSERYAAAVGLSFTDEDNLDTVRKFVFDLGPEYCTVFDSLWTRGEEPRLERINELKAESLSVTVPCV